MAKADPHSGQPSVSDCTYRFSEDPEKVVANIFSLVNRQFIKEFPGTSGDDTLVPPVTDLYIEFCTGWAGVITSLLSTTSPRGEQTHLLSALIIRNLKLFEFEAG